MQTIIRKIFINLIFIGCSVVIQAQNFQAQYLYDANGNRYRATIIYLSVKSASSDLEQVLPQGTDTANLPRKGWLKGITDSANYKVIIYPNPTHGSLLVQIVGVTQEQLSTPTSVITLWNMQGQQLITISPVDNSNLIDLTKFSSGTYILRINLEGHIKDFKIVKD